MQSTRSESTPEHVALQAAINTSRDPMMQIETHAKWQILSKLPLRVRACVPVPGVNVGRLLSLKPGQLLLTAINSTEDVPLETGSVLLGWGEFEVIDERVSLRLTRLN